MMRVPSYLRDVRLRLYVGGSVVAEDCWHRHRHSDAQLLAALYVFTDATSAVTRDGKLWQIELTDASAPSVIGTLRWGTDPHGMDEPVEVQGHHPETRLFVDGPDGAIGWEHGQRDMQRIHAAMHN